MRNVEDAVANTYIQFDQTLHASNHSVRVNRIVLAQFFQLQLLDAFRVQLLFDVFVPMSMGGKKLLSDYCGKTNHGLSLVSEGCNMHGFRQTSLLVVLNRLLGCFVHVRGYKID